MEISLRDFGLLNVSARIAIYWFERKMKNTHRHTDT